MVYDGKSVSEIKPKKTDILIGIYRHFKGGRYEVFDTARHTETDEEFVVYRNLDDYTCWVRPKENFLEHVVVGNEKVPRFEYIEQGEENNVF
jgi:hypothetical protein|tara:strand:+ start:1884 stop:2159 length:276 start_codon:yes stop_codon:yes gene_type:complete